MVWRIESFKLKPRLTKRPEEHRDNAPDAGDCPEGVRTSQVFFYALSFWGWTALPFLSQCRMKTVGRLSSEPNEGTYGSRNNRFR